MALHSAWPAGTPRIHWTFAPKTPEISRSEHEGDEVGTGTYDRFIADGCEQVPIVYWELSDQFPVCHCQCFYASRVPGRCEGQPRPSEIRIQAGTATFFESPQHVTFGGAYRKYFGRKGWGIEPEFSWMTEGNHTDNILAINLVKDLSKPTARRIWYMVMGGGINKQSTRRDVGLSVLAWGVGVKIRTGGRWFIAPQCRIGVEPNIRLSVFFGFGSRRRSQ